VKSCLSLLFQDKRDFREKINYRNDCMTQYAYAKKKQVVSFCMRLLNKRNVYIEYKDMYELHK